MSGSRLGSFAFASAMLAAAGQAQAGAVPPDALVASSVTVAEVCSASGSNAGPARGGVADHGMRYANTYVLKFTVPAVKKALAGMPEGARLAAAVRISAFCEQLLRAITDFENVEVTPDKVEAILRADNIRPDLIAHFRRKAAELRASGLADPAEVSLRAGLSMYDLRDGRRMVSEDVVALTYRSRIYSREHGGLTREQLAKMAARSRSTPDRFPNASLVDYLTGAGAPDGLQLPNYGLVRSEVVQDVKRTDEVVASLRDDKLLKSQIEEMEAENKAREAAIATLMAEGAAVIRALEANEAEQRATVKQLKEAGAQPERKEACGGRVCYRSADGRRIYRTETHDPPLWYFRDGRLAPRDLWPK